MVVVTPARMAATPTRRAVIFRPRKKLFRNNDNRDDNHHERIHAPQSELNYHRRGAADTTRHTLFAARPTFINECGKCTLHACCGCLLRREQYPRHNSRGFPCATSSPRSARARLLCLEVRSGQSGQHLPACQDHCRILTSLWPSLENPGPWDEQGISRHPL
jgi:hypothetical protein